MDYELAKGSLSFEMGEEERQISHIEILVDYD